MFTLFIIVCCVVLVRWQKAKGKVVRQKDQEMTPEAGRSLGQGHCKAC